MMYGFSKKWSRPEDRKLSLEISGKAASNVELAECLRLIAARIEGSMTSEDRKHIRSSNIPLSWSMEWPAE